MNSAKVLNGSLLAEDFEAGQLPAGQKSDKGDKGDPGPVGPPGLSGLGLMSNVSLQTSSSQKEFSVPCPAGKSLIAREIVPTESSWSLRIYAICAHVG